MFDGSDADPIVTTAFVVLVCLVTLIGFVLGCVATSMSQANKSSLYDLELKLGKLAKELKKTEPLCLVGEGIRNGEK